MAQAETQKIFNAKASDVFKTVLDFESYPEFISEVKDAKILKKNKDSLEVELTVNFVKETTYTLKVQWEKDKKIWWELLEGSLFKKNTGLWKFEDLGSQTQVYYSLDVEVKIFVPKMILKKAVSVSLPKMVESFKKKSEA